MPRISSRRDPLAAANRTQRRRRSGLAVSLLGWIACSLGAGVAGAADEGVAAAGLAAETTLLRGTGPFEVSGTPHSYAVAWVDGDERHGYTLTLTWFEAGRIESTREIAVGVDPEARIFLQVQPRQAVVAWRGGDGWRLGVFARIDARGAAPQVLELGTEVEVEALAARPDRAALLLVPQAAPAGADPGQALARVAAAAPEVESRGSESIDLPILSAPALLVVRFAAPEASVLLPVPGTITAAALSGEAELWSLTAIEPPSNRVVHLRLDPAGSATGSEMLSTFPATNALPVLSQSSDATASGWIEDRPEGPVAVMGLLSPAGALLTAERLSSPGAEPRSLALSVTRGTWAAWIETSDGRSTVRTSASEPGRSICAEGVETSVPPDNLWVLAEGGQAMVFTQSPTRHGERALTVRPVSCEALGGGQADSSPRGGGDLRPAALVAAAPEAETGILGGAEDPCDGLDNNQNGTIDEGCDRTCDNPQWSGVDHFVGGNSGIASVIGIARLGANLPSAGYGVVWDHCTFGFCDQSNISFVSLGTSWSPYAPIVRVDDPALNGNVRYPAIAWSGAEFGIAYGAWSSGLWFQRTNLLGTLLGPAKKVNDTPFGISYEVQFPGIVWNENGYGVTWQENRGSGWQMYFARLDSSGNRIGASVLVSNAAGPSYLGGGQGTLVWTGSGYAIAWHDQQFGIFDIFFARLDASGAKIGSEIRLSLGGAHSRDPSLVWTGNGYAVAWADNRDDPTFSEVYFARLDTAGNRIGGDVRVTNATGYSDIPSLAWNGSEYGLAWVDSRTATMQVYFARLDAGGAEFAEIPLASAGYFLPPALVWNGTGYTFVRVPAGPGGDASITQIRCCDDADGDGYTECAGDTEDRDPTVHPGAVETCDGRDNDSDGSIDDGCNTTCDAQSASPGSRITSDGGQSDRPTLVSTGDGFGVAWQEDRDGNPEIYFGLLDAAGNKLGPDVRVTTDPSVSEQPSLAWNGAEYGVVWHDWRAGVPGIYFARLNAMGSKIGGDVRVTNGGSFPRPSLVWSGSEYGLAWMDPRDLNWEIYFTRIDATGNKLGPDVRVTNLAGASQTPSLIWAGGVYGIAWMDDTDGNREIYFATIDAEGALLSNSRITNDSASSGGPTVAWTGTEFAVAWEDSRGGEEAIYFARISSGGAKIGGDVKVTDRSFSYGPSLEWTGSEYGISWEDYSDGGQGEIYFAPLDAQGAKIAELRLTVDPATSSFPSLARTGSGYGVAFWDTRHGNREIYFTRVGCACVGTDADADGYGSTCDCDDTNAATYPGAIEVNDGMDNQCGGEPGDGLVDEIQGTAGFIDPGDPNSFCWTSQPGATLYQVARSDQPDFASSCVVSTTSASCLADPGVPPRGVGFYYLVRPLLPNPGSWGADSTGNERIGICGL